MSMNFSHECLCTEVYSSSVSTDGCEVTNLISDVDHLRRKGFQAERFSRVPLHIVLKFAVPIQLQKVVVKPYLGQQCGKVVKLQSSIQDLKDRTMEDCINGTNYNLASVSLEKQTSVTFHNASYQNHRHLSDSPHRENQDTQTVNVRGKLSQVTAIKVSILQMLRGSVASIQCLDVWGCPSFRCNRKLSMDIIQRWIKYTQQKHSLSTSLTNISPQPAGDTSTAKTPASDIHPANKLGLNDNQISESSIPDQFLDPIVCTVMKNPVLLPSGHTIDQKTLDKHIRAQAELGQAPSDPFTGVFFTEHQKPVPNVQLKVLLDKRALDSYSNTKIHNADSQGDINGESTRGIKRSAACVNSGSRKIIKMDFDERNKQGTSTYVSSGLNSSLDVTHLTTSKYRTLQLNNSAKPNHIYCAKCSMFLSSAVIQYALPCGHCLCRTCCSNLSAELTSESYHCPDCSKSFSKTQVYRKFV